MTGLAGNLTSELRSDGYTQARTTTNRPSALQARTIIGYAPGHRAEAEAIRLAIALPSARVVPIDPGTGALVTGPAPDLVVVAGADRNLATAGSGAGTGTGTGHG